MRDARLLAPFGVLVLALGLALGGSDAVAQEEPEDAEETLCPGCQLGADAEGNDVIITGDGRMVRTDGTAPGTDTDGTDTDGTDTDATDGTDTDTEGTTDEDAGMDDADAEGDDDRETAVLGEQRAPAGAQAGAGIQQLPSTSTE